MVNVVFRSESFHKLFVSKNGFLRDVLSRSLLAVGEIRDVFLFST